MKVVQARSFETLTKLPIAPRRCSGCARVHTFIPAGAKILADNDKFDFYWWNCECRTTLVTKFSEVVDPSKKAA